MASQPPRASSSSSSPSESKASSSSSPLAPASSSSSSSSSSSKASLSSSQPQPQPSSSPPSSATALAPATSAVSAAPDAAPSGDHGSSSSSSSSSSGRKLMVFVDGSHEADTAFQAALQWKGDADELQVVHALEFAAMPAAARVSTPIGPAGRMGWMTQASVQHIEAVNKNLRARAEQLLRHYRDEAHAAKATNVSVHMVGSSEEGARESAICYTQAQHADLIFVGTRGMGAMKRFFLGSFSTYVVHHASCSVFIAKVPLPHAHTPSLPPPLPSPPLPAVSTSATTPKAIIASASASVSPSVVGSAKQPHHM